MDHLIGNERAKRYLRQILEGGHIGNTLLFAGPEGVGKSLFAHSLAASLLDNRRGATSHPDLHIYRPQGKSGLHAVQAMRDLCEEVALRPNEGRWKCFIIDDAERMLPTSANALLKTFEEPPKDTLIILVTGHREQLLPTIRSRCRTLYFEPIPLDQIARFLRQERPELSAVEAERWARRGRGSLGRALRLLAGGEDVKRELLLRALSKNELSDAGKALQVAGELAELFEREQREMGERLRSDLPDDLPAVLREGMEQEVEGAVSGLYFREIDRLFEEYLGWFRDLLLIRAHGLRSALFHADYEEALAGYEGELRPLHHVEERVRAARTAVQRFCNLSSVFGALFATR